jgi:hypothetical protein
VFDFVTSAIRSALGAAEQEVVRHSPLRETEALNDQLREAVGAVHRAADSLERHVEVVESLAVSLTPLTESVTRLTEQIGALLTITAPMAAAERDVSRLPRMFGRRRQTEPAQAEAGEAKAQDSS